MGYVGWRFRIFVSAYAVSGYGNYLNLIAVSLFSYDATGTAFGVGMIMALRLFSGFLAGMAAGVLIPRVGRRTMMICTDAAQVAAMTALALCVSQMPLWLLACAAVFLGAGNTFFTVALRSSVPVMVGWEARSDANGLLITVRSVAMVLGFTSAAPIIGFGGYATAFAINAISFAVSGVSLLVLRPSMDDGQRSDGDGDRSAEPKARMERGIPTDADSSAGVRRAWAGVPALLLGMILLRGADAMASSAHNVALPVVSHLTAQSDPVAFMTRFWASWAMGTVFAHQVLKRRRDSDGKPGSERAFAVGTCVMSFSFVLAFTGLPALAVMVAALAAGFADGWTEIIYTSRLQAAPDRQRSRLFGLSATAEQSGFALGTVAAASALEVVPPLAIVGTFHSTAVGGALALLLYIAVQRRRSRPADVHESKEGKGTNDTRTG